MVLRIGLALKDLKDSYPVDPADYAVRNQLHEYPAFAWWVLYVQKKRTAIVKKVKYKYGTVPTSTASDCPNCLMRPRQSIRKTRTPYGQTD